jgi:peptidoglycan hydrolase FlgJ
MPTTSGIDLPIPALTPAPLGRADPRTTPQDAGKKFEGMFASMLLKQMRQSLTDHGLFGHDPSDVLGGLFDHFMGQHIAERGSLGIGNMIQAQIEKRGDPT